MAKKRNTSRTSQRRTLSTMYRRDDDINWRWAFIKLAIILLVIALFVVGVLYKTNPDQLVNIIETVKFVDKEAGDRPESTHIDWTFVVLVIIGTVVGTVLLVMGVIVVFLRTNGKLPNVISDFMGVSTLEKQIQQLQAEIERLQNEPKNKENKEGIDELTAQMERLTMSPPKMQNEKEKFKKKIGVLFSDEEVNKIMAKFDSLTQEQKRLIGLGRPLESISDQKRLGGQRGLTKSLHTKKKQLVTRTEEEYETLINTLKTNIKNIPDGQQVANRRKLENSLATLREKMELYYPNAKIP